MSRIADALGAYPAETGLDIARLADAVDRLYECAGVCLACADACSAETDPQMIVKSLKCRRMDQDCADLCTVAARVIARQTGYDAPTTFAVVDATRAALRACADACDEMGEMDHCALCATVCRETEQMLGSLLDAMWGTRTDAYPLEPPSATTPAGSGTH